MLGCDINPRSGSVRILAGVWWFFTLFLSTHLIAKLGTFYAGKMLVTFTEIFFCPASVLTVEKMSVPFRSVSELIDHKEIKFGMLGHGSTYEFFQVSIARLASCASLSGRSGPPQYCINNIILTGLFQNAKYYLFEQMFQRMSMQVPSVFVKTYEEGISRVMTSQFALLMESTKIEYIIERNCNVTQIGSTINTVQYGIGTPKGQPS